MEHLFFAIILGTFSIEYIIFILHAICKIGNRMGVSMLPFLTPFHLFFMLQSKKLSNHAYFLFSATYQPFNDA